MNSAALQPSQARFGKQSRKISEDFLQPTFLFLPLLHCKAFFLLHLVVQCSHTKYGSRMRPCVSVGSQMNWIGIDPSQITLATGLSDVVCMVVVWELMVG